MRRRLVKAAAGRVRRLSLIWAGMGMGASGVAASGVSLASRHLSDGANDRVEPD